jgi:hypothetical protein
LIALVFPRGDLLLEGGTTKTIGGAEYARQRIEITLDFCLGEWFLDTRQGLPYFRDVLIKRPNDATVKSVMRRAILNTPGIVRVDTLTTSYDTSVRKLTVFFEATYEDGTTIDNGVAELIL